MYNDEARFIIKLLNYFKRITSVETLQGKERLS